ncbi:tRNA (uracil-5-)-methyltransferase homolog B-like [Sycon ciliatum]|uniref:tRNA (uracil-5-)-methyltransferase homolog B-like n=1 Tax=Sycon ciliatum TaxID=27933 RepID=UPI0020ABCFC3
MSSLGRHCRTSGGALANIWLRHVRNSVRWLAASSCHMHGRRRMKPTLYKLEPVRHGPVADGYDAQVSASSDETTHGACSEEETVQYWTDARQALVNHIETDVCYDRSMTEDASFLGGVHGSRSGDIFRHLYNGESVLPCVDNVKKEVKYFTFLHLVGMTEAPTVQVFAPWLHQTTQVRKQTVSIEKADDRIVAVVRLRTQEDLEQVKSRIAGKEFEGCLIEVMDQLRRGKPLPFEEGCFVKNDGWRSSFIDENVPENILEDKAEIISLIFARLRHFSPEEQRKIKMKDCRKDLRELSELLLQVGEPDWLASQMAKYDGFPCRLVNTMIPSVYYHHYRNKSIYLMSSSQQSDDELIVGYHDGSIDEDRHFRAFPRYKCTTMRAVMHSLSQALQDCLRQSKNFTYYRHFPRMGEYQFLTVRSSTEGENVGIIIMDGQHIKMEQVDEECKHIKAYFTEGPGKLSGLTACFLMLTEAWTSGNQVMEGYHHCFGHMYLWEKMLGLTLRCSPNVFFQSNVPCTEILYTIVNKWLNPNKNTTLIDVGCGVGSVALTNAKFCKHVHGIEKSHQAILDAKFNAKLNGIANATFHRGLLESVLPRLLAEFDEDEDVCATIDPLRHGFTDEVFLSALRTFKVLKRIVFIACRFESSKGNLVSLCLQSPVYQPDEGFRPVKAIVLDMFPQALDTEWAILLERTSAADSEPPSRESVETELDELMSNATNASATRQSAE